jgi:hypothetical protein
VARSAGRSLRERGVARWTRAVRTGNR